MVQNLFSKSSTILVDKFREIATKQCLFLTNYVWRKRGKWGVKPGRKMLSTEVAIGWYEKFDFDLKIRLVPFSYRHTANWYWRYGIRNSMHCYSNWSSCKISIWAYWMRDTRMNRVKMTRDSKIWRTLNRFLLFGSSVTWSLSSASSTWMSRPFVLAISFSTCIDIF